MRSLLRFLAIAAVWLLAAPVLAQPSPGELRVMSFNVRYGTADDGPNDWAHRRDILVETIRAEHPDVIGTQELLKDQADYIVAKLPDYTWFGIDRRGGHGDEHMGVFYRRDRLKLIEQGNFWLSDTPSVPGSISWGHPLPRMVTWGVFETKDGKRFRLLNTHFPYRAEDELAREKAAKLIADHLRQLDHGGPVILTGDFNTDISSQAHAILVKVLADAWQTTAHTGPVGTFHGFKGEPGGADRIDWILSYGFTVKRVATLTTNRNGRYPSDHFPVVADMSLEP
ncbi:endonuclease/exonuclease/phosphatase family protein [Sphingomonas sp. DT-204]|uniref:endonuclease/exonuclease/phosphatase family protein n=1 Tax=Sphingomonas sp. DT-204 TaxID=3396166 RepID=UPI003F1D8D11